MLSIKPPQLVSEPFRGPARHRSSIVHVLLLLVLLLAGAARATEPVATHETWDGATATFFESTAARGAQVIHPIPIGSFNLVHTSTGGLAADATRIYVTHVSRAEMDTYDLNGNFLATVALPGVSTYLGGYSGATNRNETDLYLTAMYDSTRASAIYRFAKDGTFLSQINLNPVVKNALDVGYDGTYAYINQNDSPYGAYRVDPATGAVIQTYASNLAHGQRLGLTYWRNGNLLIESYDAGIAVLDPANGAELQFIPRADLGYNNQSFDVDVFGDTLYVLSAFGNVNYATVHIFAIGPAVDVCFDDDGDGYGSPGSPGCPAGDLLDCDDADPLTYPGAAEHCDRRDNDCDGVLPANELDNDADGTTGCEGDCNDANPLTHPFASEIFDGQDNDCDGTTDEALDADGDGIPDFNDNCAGTAAGTGVGPDGCPICLLDDVALTLCHCPPGNPGGCHTIEVGSAAAQNHLAQHPLDHAGACTVAGGRESVAPAPTTALPRPTAELDRS